jgi:hypothetical protein
MKTLLIRVRMGEKIMIMDLLSLTLITQHLKYKMTKHQTKRECRMMKKREQVDLILNRDYIREMSISALKGIKIKKDRRIILILKWLMSQ